MWMKKGKLRKSRRGGAPPSIASQATAALKLGAAEWSRGGWSRGENREAGRSRERRGSKLYPPPLPRGRRLPPRHTGAPYTNKCALLSPAVKGLVSFTWSLTARFSVPLLMPSLPRVRPPLGGGGLGMSKRSLPDPASAARQDGRRARQTNDAALPPELQGKVGSDE